MIIKIGNRFIALDLVTNIERDGFFGTSIHLIGGEIIPISKNIDWSKWDEKNRDESLKYIADQEKMAMANIDELINLWANERMSVTTKYDSFQYLKAE